MSDTPAQSLKTPTVSQRVTRSRTQASGSATGGAPSTGRSAPRSTAGRSNAGGSAGRPPRFPSTTAKPSTIKKSASRQSTKKSGKKTVSTDKKEQRGGGVWKVPTTAEVLAIVEKKEAGKQKTVRTGKRQWRLERFGIPDSDGEPYDSFGLRKEAQLLHDRKSVLPTDHPHHNAVVLKYAKMKCATVEYLASRPQTISVEACAKHLANMIDQEIFVDRQKNVAVCRAYIKHLLKAESEPTAAPTEDAEPTTFTSPEKDVEAPNAAQVPAAVPPKEGISAQIAELTAAPTEDAEPTTFTSPEKDVGTPKAAQVPAAVPPKEGISAQIAELTPKEGISAQIAELTGFATLLLQNQAATSQQRAADYAATSQLFRDTNQGITRNSEQIASNSEQIARNSEQIGTLGDTVSGHGELLSEQRRDLSDHRSRLDNIEDNIEKLLVLCTPKKAMNTSCRKNWDTFDISKTPLTTVKTKLVSRFVDEDSSPERRRIFAADSPASSLGSITEEKEEDEEDQKMSPRSLVKHNARGADTESSSPSLSPSPSPSPLKRRAHSGMKAAPEVAKKRRMEKVVRTTEANGLPATVKIAPASKDGTADEEFGDAEEGTPTTAEFAPASEDGTADEEFRDAEEGTTAEWNFLASGPN